VTVRVRTQALLVSAVWLPFALWVGFPAWMLPVGVGFAILLARRDERRELVREREPVCEPFEQDEYDDAYEDHARSDAVTWL
jgi:hypothetical protein